MLVLPPQQLAYLVCRAGCGGDTGAHPTFAGGARQIARQSSVAALMGGRRASMASLHKRAEYAQAMDAVRATWMQVSKVQDVLPFIPPVDLKGVM